MPNVFLCRPKAGVAEERPVLSQSTYDACDEHLALQTNAALALAAPAPARGATHGAATAGGR